jgi:hypothetical protein
MNRATKCEWNHAASARRSGVPVASAMSPNGASGGFPGVTRGGLLLVIFRVSDQNSRRPIPPSPPSVHAQRRDPGSPRRAASDRVVLRSGDAELGGWTLNVSRGGARLVLEEGGISTGQHWDLWVNGAAAARPIRVVWVRDEAGGQIAGVQFLDCDGTIPPVEEHSSGK